MEGNGEKECKKSIKEEEERENSRRKIAMAPPRSAKLNDISDELKRIIDANFDKVFARRRAREAFEGVMLSIDHSLFKVF